MGIFEPFRGWYRISPLITAEQLQQFMQGYVPFFERNVLLGLIRSLMSLLVTRSAIDLPFLNTSLGGSGNNFLRTGSAVIMVQ